jgi:YegS/Rv2252/BmrU family lipid kinase
MKQANKIGVVVNPRSGGGKTDWRWPQIFRVLEERLGPVSVRSTKSCGDGLLLARELLREGHNLIVAAGGDGTINEVANGFLENDEAIFPGACLGVLPLGTGGDFRRTLGIGREVEDAIATLATGAPLRMDVGKATLQGEDGSPRSQYFVNVASFGMGGEVALRAEGTSRPFGGTAAFLWATFRVLMGYRGKTVRLELDGEKLPGEFCVTNVAVGNGEFHGGGMHPCPKAVLNDGILEVTVIDRLGVFELVRNLRVLYSEDIYRHPKVHHFRARKVVAQADEVTRVEIDGEPLGSLPFEGTILPERLPVMVPRNSRLLSGKPA